MVGGARWLGLIVGLGLACAAGAQEPPPSAASAPTSMAPPPALSYTGCMAQLAAPAVVERLPMLRNPEHARYVCSCAQGRRFGGEAQGPPSAATVLQRATILLGCSADLLRRSPDPSAADDAFVAGLASAMTPAPASRGVTLPRIQFEGACAKPEYPAAALRAEATGTTGLMMRVNTKGDVSDAYVLRSAGPTREHKLLDAVTMSTLRTCRFAPATEGGEAIDAWIAMQYVWRLR